MWELNNWQDEDDTIYIEHNIDPWPVNPQGHGYLKQETDE